MADIPINPVTRRVEFTGNTGTGPFAFTFNVLAQADVAVYKNNTLLALTSDYTVSLNSNGTGSITLTSALIATDELVIIGDLALSRTTDFVTAGDLLASSLNEQFDSNVVMSQQLDERFDRTIRSQPGDINKNLYLPLVSSRASQLLSFDSSGNITTTSLSNVPDIGTVNLTVSGVASFADGSASAPSITNIGDTNTGMYFGAADQINFSVGGSEVISVASTGTTISGLSISSGDILLTDNSATALEIKEGSNNYLTFITTNGSEKLSFGSTANPTFEVNGSFRQPLIAATTSFFSQTYSGATLSATNGSVNIESYSASKAGIVLNGSGDQITFTSPTLGFVGLVQVVGAITTNTSLNIASSTTVDGILDEDNMGSNSATKLATQQSIKAYVDAQVGTVDTLAEVLGNGNTTGGTNIVVSANDVISLDDGTNALPSLTTTGDLNTGIYFPAADEVGITTGGTQRVKVDSTGINVTGTVTATGTSVFASLDISGDIDVDGTTNLDVVDIDGAVDFASTTAHAGNATFADNAKAIFGAGSDLQIYHDGANSYISDQGAGDLLIRSSNDLWLQNADGTETYARFDEGASTYISYAGSTKLTTTSTGVDITGTLTSDGLTVDGVGTFNAVDPYIRFNASTSVDYNIGASSAGGFYVYDVTNAATRFLVDDNGDISFYEDTGTTAKFFWDASAERLGLGTTNAAAILHLTRSSDTADIKLESSGGSGRIYTIQSRTDGNFSIVDSTAGGVQRVTVDSSGRVGIGTSPSYNLDVSASNAVSMIRTPDTTPPTLGLFVNSGSNGVGTISVDNGGHMTFDTGSSGAGQAERMRLNSSGHLLIGKTADDNTTAGTVIHDNGFMSIARSSNIAMILDRHDTDGEILRFTKSGTSVGSIATSGDDLTVGNDVTTVKFHNGLNTIHPNGTGSGSDGLTTLGWTNNRFKDLYLSGGVYLGGTGSANKLDDYEEGTWTPTFSNIGTGTYAIQLGSYIKIGSLVTVQCHLGINAIGSASGTLKVGGFPFTSSNTVGAIYGVSSSIHGTGWSTQRNSVNLILGPNATETNDAYYNMASGSVFNPTHADIGGGNLLFSMTYRTDA